MPNLDGTGPNGQGPRTGRGRGNCVNGENNNQNVSAFGKFVQRFGFGRGGRRGRGQGRGKGFGRGLGRGFGIGR